MSWTKKIRHVIGFCGKKTIIWPSLCSVIKHLRICLKLRPAIWIIFHEILRFITTLSFVHPFLHASFYILSCFCSGGHELSKTTGNAGGRIACGKQSGFLIIKYTTRCLINPFVSLRRLKNKSLRLCLDNKLVEGIYGSKLEDKEKIREKSRWDCKQFLLLHEVNHVLSFIPFHMLAGTPVSKGILHNRQVPTADELI